jgi:hypothetical protein
MRSSRTSNAAAEIPDEDPETVLGEGIERNTAELARRRQRGLGVESRGHGVYAANRKIGA